MKKVLFLCGKARMRSPTTADLLSDWPGFQADFAGLSRDAEERVPSEHIEWADVIVVMEKRQRTRLTNRFGALLNGRKIAVLGVPDRFAYMEPALVDLLNRKLRQLFGLKG